MRKIGYARTSKNEQHLSLEYQEEQLRNAGCEIVFSEHVSGRKAERIEFNKMREELKSGDILSICKLDRLGRTTKQLIEFAEELEDNDIDLEILDMKINTREPFGRMFFTMMSAFAQLEADLISERTKNALSQARKQGRKGGRKKEITEAQLELAKKLMKDESLSGQEIADRVEISRASLYRIIREDRQKNKTK